MARLRAPALVWISSAILFYLVFKSAMDTSNSTSNLLQSPNSVEPSLAVSDRRSRLYDEMSRDLNERGAVFLNGGETSQSLALSDIFELRDGVVTPILKAANPPVRANVLHLSSEFARPISEAVGKIFLPYFDGDIRATLRKALPNAPEKQLYDPVLLHTSFARLLGHPKLSLEESKLPFDQLHFFHELVARVNDKIHGFEATISELWFVEEYDVLALALNGRMKARRFHMGCSGGD
ncbi:uncharacterized protein [Typha latifolia]|uniref:uncharacterized protein isoform X3 n=1 Tax=Typha latifolia TaxID=4733 RepID=UPI003C2EE106